MLPDVSPNVTINESAPSTVVELWGDELAYNRKYVTHRTLTPTCRYSLKVHSRLRHSSCKIRTINLSLSLSRTVSVSCLYCKRWLHRYASVLQAIWLQKFWETLGDIRHFVPGWPNIVGGCAPAFPVALTPVQYIDHKRLKMRFDVSPPFRCVTHSSHVAADQST